MATAGGAGTAHDATVRTDGPAALGPGASEADYRAVLAREADAVVERLKEKIALLEEHVKGAEVALREAQATAKSLRSKAAG